MLCQVTTLTLTGCALRPCTRPWPDPVYAGTGRQVTRRPNTSLSAEHSATHSSPTKQQRTLRSCAAPLASPFRSLAAPCRRHLLSVLAHNQSRAICKSVLLCARVKVWTHLNAVALPHLVKYHTADQGQRAKGNLHKHTGFRSSAPSGSIDQQGLLALPCLPTAPAAITAAASSAAARCLSKARAANHPAWHEACPGCRPQHEKKSAAVTANNQARSRTAA